MLNMILYVKKLFFFCTLSSPYIFCMGYCFECTIMRGGESQAREVKGLVSF